MITSFILTAPRASALSPLMPPNNPLISNHRPTLALPSPVLLALPPSATAPLPALLPTVPSTYPHMNASCSTSRILAHVALRLLYSLEMQGLLPSESTDLPNRIGGLLVSDLQKVLEEGGEVAEKIREGGMRMSRARNKGGLHGAVMVEEVVLWAVITNAVEVQVSKGPAVGVAVYGPWFSWFNHSCSPNACYRFELEKCCEESTSCESSSFRVFPASTGEASIAVRFILAVGVIIYYSGIFF